VASAAALGGAVSEVTGGKFANGAVTGAFSRGFGEVSREISRFVSGGPSERISVEAARAEFDKVIDALSTAGEDVSNISFDPRYGVSVNGELAPTSDFDTFESRAYGRGGENTLGTTDVETGRITIFRNAFSTTITHAPISSRDIDNIRINLPGGFRSGLFVTAHEIGHRVNQHHIRSSKFEYRANAYAHNIFKNVCDGGRGC